MKKLVLKTIINVAAGIATSTAVHEYASYRQEITTKAIEEEKTA
jgi:hypothetical protein